MSSLIPPVLPIPGKLPAFDNTLGALFIGHTLASILYGIACLQLFVYITGRRTQTDRLWLKILVYFLFFVDISQAVETAHQAMMSAGMYRFVITDYLNPLALPTGGVASGEVFIFAQSILLTITTVIVQLFFCRRIWMLSSLTLTLKFRIPFIILMISLATFSFGSSLGLAITGFNHRLLTGNTPDFILSFKLFTTSQVIFDVIVTAAMTFFLSSAQTNVERTNRVVRIIIIFIVNCNLISTLLSISSLITFLALPHATVYGGIGFLLGKTYFNSFLAILNSREFLGEKLSQTTVIDERQFHFAPAQHTTESGTANVEYELGNMAITFNNESNKRSEKDCLPGSV